MAINWMKYWLCVNVSISDCPIRPGHLCWKIWPHNWRQLPQGNTYLLQPLWWCHNVFMSVKSSLDWYQMCGSLGYCWWLILCCGACGDIMILPLISTLFASPSFQMRKFQSKVNFLKPFWIGYQANCFFFCIENT